MSAGTLVDIDVIAEKLYSFKLTRSYDHPAVLRFKANTTSEFVTTVASSTRSAPSSGSGMRTM
jgi:hypothetical protein